MKAIKSNKLSENILNLVDTVTLTTIDGQKLTAYPTYRFSDKEWSNIKLKDKRKFLAVKAKYIRMKKKASKNNNHELKDPPTVIKSLSTDTKAFSQITEITLSSKKEYSNEVLSEEKEIMEHIEKKLKSMDRDDILFIQQFEGCIVKLDTDCLSMASIAARKKRQ